MKARTARERIAAALGSAGGALAAHPDPLPAIDRAVAGHYGVAPAALASRRRGAALARARRAAWALGYAGARQPLAALCRRYGGRGAAGIAAIVRAVGDGLETGGGAACELAALATRACAGAPPAPGGPAPPDRPPRAARRRPCLTCGAPFDSEGPHNRMCDACRDERSGEPEECAVHVALEEFE